MDTISDIQNEQTPFTFKGDEQALRDVVKRAVYTLPGSRITSRTYTAYLATNGLSLSDAAWIERYTETVRGVDVRRLRAIWIGDARLEGTGPILSFSYRCAYVDRPDEEDTTLSALRRRNVNPRDPEWGHMKLHVKAPKATGKPIEGKIEAPPLLRFAVDAILQAIEEAGREVQMDAPTGSAPSDDAGKGTPGASEEPKPREQDQIKTTAAHFGIKTKRIGQEVAAQSMNTSDRTYRKYRDFGWLLSDDEFMRITGQTVAEYWTENGGR